MSGQKPGDCDLDACALADEAFRSLVRTNMHESDGMRSDSPHALRHFTWQGEHTGRTISVHMKARTVS